jgi:S1-C subfamily serine protease
MNPRTFSLLILLATLLTVATIIAERRDEAQPQPLGPDPALEAALAGSDDAYSTKGRDGPPPQPFRGAINLKSPRQNGDLNIGTAFAVSDSYWITAQHVADSCSALRVEAPPRQIRNARLQPLGVDQDLALLAGRVGAEPMRLATREPEPGEEVIISGFPQGRPGEVRAVFDGWASVFIEGTGRPPEYQMVFNVLDVVPEGLGYVGGLSGGPILARDGTVLAVASGARSDSGLILGAPPTRLIPVVGQDEGFPAPYRVDADWRATADALRGDGRVARVFCKSASG